MAKKKESSGGCLQTALSSAILWFGIKTVGGGNAFFGACMIFVGACWLLIIIITQIQALNKKEKEESENTGSKGMVDPDNYAAIARSAYALYKHIQLMNKDPQIKEMLEHYDEQLRKADELRFTVSPRLGMLTLVDVIQSYKQIGYSIDLHTNEGNALAMYALLLTDLNAREYIYDKQKMEDGGIEKVTRIVDAFANHFESSFPEDQSFVVELARSRDADEDLVNKYVVLLYRFLSLVAKVDNVVTDKESEWLKHIMSFSSEKPEGNDTGKEKAKSDGEAEKQLMELIGLQSAKEEIVRLTNYVKVQKLRAEKKLSTTPISYHCVFTGSPGTGKTTVARIVAEIYCELGILRKGHLVETDRSGLVAEYVGQTAVKTNKIIDKALDGVLFIDEAYSLVQGDKNDFGLEAIATLLKRMEDDRDRLVVILAGYGDEMQQFIDSNPGLQSRFTRYIHFDDYSADELMEIFDMRLSKFEYTMKPEANAALAQLFANAVATKTKNFGNARFARNVFERTIENQASRLANKNEITDVDLQTIEAIDIPLNL